MRADGRTAEVSMKHNILPKKFPFDFGNSALAFFDFQMALGTFAKKVVKHVGDALRGFGFGIGPQAFTMFTQ